ISYRRMRAFDIPRVLGYTDGLTALFPHEESRPNPAPNQVSVPGPAGLSSDLSARPTLLRTERLRRICVNFLSLVYRPCLGIHRRHEYTKYLPVVRKRDLKGHAYH